MDLGHVARLSRDRRAPAEQLAASDRRSDIELAGSLRPTLKRALESLKALYEDEDVWYRAEQAVAAVDVPTRQLIQSVTDYPKSPFHLAGEHPADVIAGLGFEPSEPQGNTVRHRITTNRKRLFEPRSAVFPQSTS